MDKKEWKAWLRPFVRQMGVVIEKERKDTVHGPKMKGALGSHIVSSSRETWKVFSLDESALEQSDATVLFAHWHASLEWIMRSERLSLATLARFAKELTKDPLDPLWSRFLERAVVRLPTAFLEDPLDRNEETFIRTWQAPVSKATCTRMLIMGNEALQTKIASGGRDAEHQTELLCAIATVCKEVQGGSCANHSVLDCATRLKEMNDLCRRYQAVMRGEEATRLQDLIETYHCFFEMVGLSEHPDVQESYKILRIPPPFSSK